MKTIVAPLVAACFAATGAPAQEGRPDAWRVLPDAPGADSAVAFVGMPPGWHVTTRGTGALLVDAANRAAGAFGVEGEVFLFPGESTEGFGIVVGGTGLGTDTASYLAFLVRGDGRAAVMRMAHGRAAWPHPWHADSAVVPRAGGEPVRNVLRVEAGPAALTFAVNGSPVASLPRAALPAEGVVGMRVGAALDLHVSRLDLIRHLAPPRPPAPSAAP